MSSFEFAPERRSSGRATTPRRSSASTPRGPFNGGPSNGAPGPSPAPRPSSASRPSNARASTASGAGKRASMGRVSMAGRASMVTRPSLVGKPSLIAGRSSIVVAQAPGERRASTVGGMPGRPSTVASRAKLVSSPGTKFWRIIFVVGPPSSGKSTACAAIVRDFGYAHINITDLSAEETFQQLEGAMAPGGRLVIEDFPQSIDFAVEFEQRWPSTLDEAVLIVLDASDDREVLQRADSRGWPTSFRHVEDAHEYFMVRLDESRKAMPDVINHFMRRGSCRFVNASAPPDIVVDALRTHLRPTMIFVPSGTGKEASDVCEKLTERGSGRHVRVENLVRMHKESRNGVTGQQLVDAIRKEVASFGRAGLWFLDGFPRHSEDLDAWLSIKAPPQPLLLRVESTEPPQPRLLRPGEDPNAAMYRFEVWRRQTVPALDAWTKANMCETRYLDEEAMDLYDEAWTIVQGCQPTCIPVPQAAATLLCAWLAVGPRVKWWDFPLDEVIPRYARCLLLAAEGKLTGLPPDVWVVWVTHALQHELYAQHCRELFDGMPGLILRPPDLSGRTDDLIQACLDPGPEVEKKLREAIKDDSVTECCSFFGALMAHTERRGLAPLSDPRSFAWHSSVVEEYLSILNAHYKRLLFQVGTMSPASDMSEYPRSLELEWLWRAHVLHPAEYQADCQRLFGKDAPYRGRDLRELWNDAEGDAVKENDSQVLSDATGLQTALDMALKGFGTFHEEGLLGLREALQEAEDDDDDDEDDPALKALRCLIPGGDADRMGEALVQNNGDIGLALQSILADGGIGWTLPPEKKPPPPPEEQLLQSQEQLPRSQDEPDTGTPKAGPSAMKEQSPRPSQNEHSSQQTSPKKVQVPALQLQLQALAIEEERERKMERILGGSPAKRKSSAAPTGETTHN